MKATGIVRRVDSLGRVVIPKEIRHTLRIKEGSPLLTSLTASDDYLVAMEELLRSSPMILSCSSYFLHCWHRWFHFPIP